MGRHSRGLRAYCIEDTDFAKKEHHTVGIRRHFSGRLGKVVICWVAVSLHAMGPQQSGCVDATLYLPQGVG